MQKILLYSCSIVVVIEIDKITMLTHREILKQKLNPIGEIIMKENNRRILAYTKSTKISEDELKDVQAGGSSQPTGNGSYNNGHFDGGVDINVDF